MFATYFLYQTKCSRPKTCISNEFSLEWTASQVQHSVSNASATVVDPIGDVIIMIFIINVLTFSNSNQKYPRVASPLRNSCYLSLCNLHTFMLKEYEKYFHVHNFMFLTAIDGTHTYVCLQLHHIFFFFWGGGRGRGRGKWWVSFLLPHLHQCTALFLLSPFCYGHLLSSPPTFSYGAAILYWREAPYRQMKMEMCTIWPLLSFS